MSVIFASPSRHRRVESQICRHAMVKGILRFNLTGTALGVSNHISVIPSLRSRTFEVENYWPPRDSIICSNSAEGRCRH